MPCVALLMNSTQMLSHYLSSGSQSFTPHTRPKGKGKGKGEGKGGAGSGAPAVTCRDTNLKML